MSDFPDGLRRIAASLKAALADAGDAMTDEISEKILARNANGYFPLLITRLEEAAKRIEGLQKVIRYWSFCTWEGLQKWAPEKEAEFKELCQSLGISPYSRTEPRQ